MSHEEKKLGYFPLYWLLNRDPYNGLLLEKLELAVVLDVFFFVFFPIPLKNHPGPLFGGSSQDL